MILKINLKPISLQTQWFAQHVTKLPAFRTCVWEPETVNLAGAGLFFCWKRKFYPAPTLSEWKKCLVSTVCTWKLCKGQMCEIIVSVLSFKILNFYALWADGGEGGGDTIVLNQFFFSKQKPVKWPARQHKSLLCRHSATLGWWIRIRNRFPL